MERQDSRRGKAVRRSVGARWADDMCPTVRAQPSSGHGRSPASRFKRIHGSTSFMHRVLEGRPGNARQGSGSIHKQHRARTPGAAQGPARKSQERKNSRRKTNMKKFGVSMLFAACCFWLMAGMAWAQSSGNFTYGDTGTTHCVLSKSNGSITGGATCSSGTDCTANGCTPIPSSAGNVCAGELPPFSVPIIM